ncbi:MAG: BON domain-containing protein [Alphaproteobacteria bacterium]|nr:BON domain-containing protein [Alphaproteobacteria bacterium]
MTASITRALAAAAVFALLAVGAGGALQADTRTASRIAGAVERLLARDAATFDLPIRVSVEGAVVRLDGISGDLAARDRAGELTERVAGVRAVVNDIKVVPPARDEDDVSREANEILRGELGSGASGMSVAVDDGIASLSGTARTAIEFQLALQLLRSVPGIERIEPAVEVEDGPELPDPAIADAVAARLAWDIWTTDAPIDVSVSDAVVALEGSVFSPWIRTRASKLASGVPGVDMVDISALRVSPAGYPQELRERPFRPSDTDIALAIRAAIAADPALGRLNIVPSVDDGNVALAGRVDTPRQQTRVFEIARNTVGVRQVDTFITVEPERSPPDSELAASVAVALANDAAFKLHPVAASAENGVVTLTGSVPDRPYRARAEQVTDRVLGVRDVSNLITVQAAASADADRRLAEAVREALFWNPSIDEDAITVRVDRGVVELTGTVKTLRALNLADDLAREAGAARVENRLRVGF